MSRNVSEKFPTKDAPNVPPKKLDGVKPAKTALKTAIPSIVSLVRGYLFT